MLAVALFAAAALLSFANGANDNFKGVASLYASRTVGYRTALAWGTAATLLGSLASIFLAQGLLAAFSGKGLVPAEIAGAQLFLLCVASGAAGTVLLATIVGFPISTTHSLVGGIVGAGALAAGPELNSASLISAFLLPLVASPLLAFLLAAGLYRTLHHWRSRLRLEKDHCVCVAAGIAATPTPSPSGTLVMRQESLRLSLGPAHECRPHYAGRWLGVELQRVVDAGHFLSAGLVSFARGVNDTPKIAALLLALQFVDVPAGLSIVGLGMALGALLAARRVAHTLGDKITTMNHGQGLAANLATGFLVIGASRLGLPVSTTHVSVGGLFGIGLTTGQANLPVIRDVALSWVVTLPCAALIAGASYWLLA